MKQLLNFSAYIFLGTAIFFASCHENKLPLPLSAVNKAPVANAGPDQTFTLLSTDSIILDGSASHDPDGSIANYQWKRISGPPTILLSNSNRSTALVTSAVPGKITAGVYEFELTVRDNDGLLSSDRVVINISIPGKPVNVNVVEYGTNQPIPAAMLSIETSRDYYPPFSWTAQNLFSDNNGNYSFRSDKFHLIAVTKTGYWNYGFETFYGDDPSLLLQGIHTADSFTVIKIPQTYITVHIQNSIATLTNDVFFNQWGSATAGFPGPVIFLRPNIDTSFQYQLCGNMNNIFTVGDDPDGNGGYYNYLHQGNLFVPKTNNITYNIIY